MFIVGFLDGSACGYERDLAHGYKVMLVNGRWLGGRREDPVDGTENCIMAMVGTREAFDKAGEFFDQGQYLQAYRTTTQLYRKNPYFPPIVALHVSVILKLSRVEEGIRIAKRSLRHITNKLHRVVVLNALGDGLSQAGNLDEAIELFRREIELQPQEPSLVSGLGYVLGLNNQKDEVVKLVEAARDRGVMKPPIAGVFGMAVKRTDRCHEAIELMEGLIEEAGGIEAIDELQWSIMFNSLGHLYDYTKRYDDAMAAFTKSKKLVPAKYVDEQIAYEVQVMKKAWTAERFVGVQRPEPGTPCPVFIVGMPRSGTTLTEQIIDAHPHGYGAGELSLISELIKDILPDPRKPFSPGPEEFDPEKVAEMARIYRAETLSLAGNGDVRVITDKAPGNCWNLGIIALAFPDAKIIHCRREPRDNCLSCFFQALSAGHSYSFDLGDCGRYYRHYREMTDHFTELLMDDRVGGAIFENHYEDTVADLEGKTRALLDFVGLEFDQSCLDFHKSGRVALTLSNDQVRQPIYTSSTKRYEHYIDHIGDLVEALGDVIPEGAAK